MKFVIDENLPPRLATWLRERGHDAIHSSACVGLGAADDALLKFALDDERVVVTKDADFESPKAGRVLRFRIGNCDTEALLAWLAPQLDTALRQLNAGSTYVELA
jgi:predicted nuclease of predicted toxin-antitoxin system